jgi:SRSO17 transposase
MSVSRSVSEVSAEEEWTSKFEELCERIGPYFARSETRERSREYLRGLLSPIERKNGWQLAEQAGESRPYGMQHLLNRAVWESDGLREELQAYVGEMIGDEHAVLVRDETGFVKKGKKSVGVQRQYSGTAGRIENCQIGVFLSYASQGEHTLVDRELYLPKSWTEDPERSRAAGVAEDVVFATKPELAARMLWRTLDGGLPAKWVAGDTVYGSNRPLRKGLEQRLQRYALAVACCEHVEVHAQHKRVDALAGSVSAHQWQRLSAGEGSKGLREFDWACIELDQPEAEGWGRFLVLRRSLPTGEKTPQLAYVLVFAPAGTPLAEMVPVIGTRWTVEQCFEEDKGEVGLDQYEVRSFHGWYRHITLCMLAHAFLVALRIHSQQPPEKNRCRPFQSHLGSMRIFTLQCGLACP